MCLSISGVVTCYRYTVLRTYEIATRKLWTLDLGAKELGSLFLEIGFKVKSFLRTVSWNPIEERI